MFLHIPNLFDIELYMARPSYPSDDVDKLLLRFPAGMRDQIKMLADRNGRSMNAEIVKRLADSLYFEEVLQLQREAGTPEESDYGVPSEEHQRINPPPHSLLHSAGDREYIRAMMDEIKQYRDELRDIHKELSTQIFSGRKSDIGRE